MGTELCSVSISPNPIQKAMKHKGVFVLALSLAGCIENELPIPVREPGNAEIRYADLGPDYGAWAVAAAMAVVVADKC